MDTPNIKPTVKDTVAIMIEDIRKTAVATKYSFSSDEFNLIMQLQCKDESTITKEELSRLLEISAAVKKTKEQRENEQRQQEEAKQKELDEMSKQIEEAIRGGYY